MIGRRSFLRGLAALALAPAVAPALKVFPTPIQERLGAWAIATIKAGTITAVTITSAGSGYTQPSTITILGPSHE